MKKLLLMIIVIIGLVTYSFGYSVYDAKLIRKYTRIISKFDRSQWETATYLYNACAKYGLGYTCVAIGFVESRLGKYLINEKTHDYGITGINIYYYFKDHGLKWNYWKAQRLKTRLVVENDFAISETIEKLNAWRDRYDNTSHMWLRIWGSYNGGNKPNYKYAKKIYNFIKAFRWYIRKHNINIIFEGGN